MPRHCKLHVPLHHEFEVRPAGEHRDRMSDFHHLLCPSLVPCVFEAFQKVKEIRDICAPFPSEEFSHKGVLDKLHQTANAYTHTYILSL